MVYKPELAWYKRVKNPYGVDVHVVSPDLWYSDEWYKFSTISIAQHDFYYTFDKNKSGVLSKYLVCPQGTPVYIHIGKYTEALPPENLKNYVIQDRNGGEFPLDKVFAVHLEWLLGTMNKAEDQDIQYKRNHFITTMIESDNARRECWECISSGELYPFIDNGVPFERMMA